jgi:hypothetical protein
MNHTAALDQPTLPSRYTSSFGVSLAVTSVANALLVVAKETNPTTVMVWMKRASGHHWATHSLFSLILFFALGLALAQTNGGRGPQLTASGLVKIIVAGVAAGGLIILGFYLFLD